MKSDLLTRLEEFCVAQTDAPMASSVTVEKAAIVQMLQPKGATTFPEYASSVFIPYIVLILHNATCLSLVWDRYIEDSREGMAMGKCGKGVCR